MHWHALSYLFSPQTTRLRIPGEITDIIISFVADAQRARECYPSLCSCSLVCRSWLPASRHHLFMNVDIRSDRQYTLLISRVVVSVAMRPWLSSTCRLDLFFPVQNDADDSRGALSRLFAFELSGVFPNLQDLHLVNLDWTVGGAYPHQRIFAGLSAFSSLRTLILWQCQFPSFKAVRRTVSSFRSLEVLSWHRVWWPIANDHEEHHAIPQTALLPRALSTLLFWSENNDCDGIMLRWLSKTPLPASFRCIDTHSTILSLVPEFWDRIGSSLTNLTVHLQQGDLQLNREFWA